MRILPRGILVTALCTLLAVFSGCKPGPSGSDSVQWLGPKQAGLPRLHKYWELPEFELTTHVGAAFSKEKMLDKVWVVDFFYTSCPGPCPALTSRLSGMHQKFSKEPKVGFLSISGDPQKDSPEVLSVYAQRFKADDRWVFLTGEKDRIYALANEGFKMSMKEMPGEQDSVSHSTRLVLVDKQGWVRGFYEGVGEESDEATGRLEADIGELLK
jgi:protein SCO1/2